jgi:hypothetical protein
MLTDLVSNMAWVLIKRCILGGDLQNTNIKVHNSLQKIIFPQANFVQLYFLSKFKSV